VPPPETDRFPAPVTAPLTSSVAPASMIAAAADGAARSASTTWRMKLETEAARSLGLSQRKTLQYIIIPQAVRNVLPTLGNEFVVVIKESSIVSIIGIADLMYKANTVRGNTFQPFEPLLIAALVYFALTFPLSKFLARIERRMRAHV